MITEEDNNWFKLNYCSSVEKRKQILVDFQVSVASFEELLFGQYINSYARGERRIENTFMILNVIDKYRNKTYNPVFSEKVAREMLRYSSIEIPRKITIFSGESNHSGNYKKQKFNSNDLKDKRTEANRALLYLIELVRALMLFNIYNPMPMHGVFKQIYDNLILYPDKDPFSRKIKSINTALGKYIESHGANKGFNHLSDFIKYLKQNSGSKQLKNIDLEILRSMFIMSYPHEKLYF